MALSMERDSALEERLFIPVIRHLFSVDKKMQCLTDGIKGKSMPFIKFDERKEAADEIEFIFFPF
jgi:hypothetical protein